MDDYPKKTPDARKSQEGVNIDVFRKNLENLMRAKGLNKGELARQSGVGPDMLYKFFQGRSSSFDAVEASKLAKTLNTTVDDLLGAPDPKVLEAFSFIQRLSKRERDIVLRQIEQLVADRQAKK